MRKFFTVRQMAAAAFLSAGTLWAQSAQANCYCEQGHFAGNVCVAPVGPGGSVIPIANVVCRPNRAPRPEPRRLSLEERKRLDEAAAATKKNNPGGCNPHWDGLAFCWKYWEEDAGGETRFWYTLQGTVASQHGMQYLYDNETGRLKEIQIYDRGIIPKGENGYAFHHDGTATVVDYKNNNDPRNIRRHYSVPAAEALNRLGLPQSVLQLNLRPDNGILGAMQSRLPSGCSGTAKASLFKPACGIGLLHNRQK